MVKGRPLIDRRQYLIKKFIKFGNGKPAASPPLGDAAKLTNEELKSGRVRRPVIMREITEEERSQGKLLFGKYLEANEVATLEEELKDIEEKLKMTPEERKEVEAQQACQAVLPGGSLSQKIEEKASETQDVVERTGANVPAHVDDKFAELKEMLALKLDGCTSKKNPIAAKNNEIDKTKAQLKKLPKHKKAKEQKQVSTSSFEPPRAGKLWGIEPCSFSL